MANEADSREQLINILRLAYSGELAAAYAYRGHWHSVIANQFGVNWRILSEKCSPDWVVGRVNGGSGGPQSSDGLWNFFVM